MKKPRIIRLTTVPISLSKLLHGQLQFINNNGFEVLAVSSPGNYLDAVSVDEGVKTKPIVMTRLISPIRDMISIVRFYFLCKKFRPDIVHSHTPKAGLIGMLGAKLAGVPIRLHTVAGLPLMEEIGFKRFILEVIEKIIYSSATMIYPNSKGLYDYIAKKRFVKVEKLKVLANGSSNGIDTDYFKIELISEYQRENLRNNLMINPGDFVFVFVGRLVKDKGINELITVFSKISEARTNAKLLLVGKFEDELDGLELITKNEIFNNPNILFAGFQNDVRPYFAISDCLVFPSYREGFPNVVMQAGAMGLPSIVTNINGCNEIIVDYQNGIIIPPKSIINLEKAMLKLLEDNQLKIQLSSNSRHLITSRYDQNYVWNEILKEYNYYLRNLSK